MSVHLGRSKGDTDDGLGNVAVDCGGLGLSAVATVFLTLSSHPDADERPVDYTGEFRIEGALRALALDRGDLEQMREAADSWADGIYEAWDS